MLLGDRFGVHLCHRFWVSGSNKELGNLGRSMFCSTVVLINMDKRVDHLKV